MKEFLDNTYKYLGLLNEKGNPSGHKLTAAATLVLFLGYAHYKVFSSDKLISEMGYMMVVVDWICVMLLLGRITFADVLKFKNGDKGTEENK